jgi:hydrogenase expression/formation protein HypC
MCLGVPGEVLSIKENFAEVDFGGIKREVSLLLCPDVKEGDYVLIHVGFAIQRLDEEEALETLRLLEELERGWLEETEEVE